MTAAYVTGLGTPDVIRVGELPVPVPGPTDVLVRTAALAVNHVDTFVRSGAYRTYLPFPFIVGRDVVGTVAATGGGVAGFAAGDRVWCNSLGHDGRQGPFAQYALVPVERLYQLPDAADPSTAVSVLHTAATAYLGLFREGRVRAGETIVVGGAAGGVGSAVVRLATAAGARVIATAAERDVEWCRSCGARTVLDYRDPDLPARIGAAAPGGVDLFWDTSGRHDLDATLPLLARGARVILMAGLAARPVLPVGALYTRDISLRGFAISNASTGDLHAAAMMINDLLAAGELRTRIAATLPLADTARAHRLQETGGHDRPRGRIVVVP
jgi:NADPH:quinone reductase-like Zn-dependent oxidoreductase